MNKPNRCPDERLGNIVGRWRTSGHVIGEPNIPVAGTDIYELFPGGHFLVHHVDVTVGDLPVRAIEVIGEPDDGGYLARSFDSDGKSEVMHMAIGDDGVFRFVGGGEIARSAQPSDVPTARVRSALTVAHDRNSMTARWERSEDGTIWHHWMDIRFTRIDDASASSKE
jgi:hypothetical protein